MKRVQPPPPRAPSPTPTAFSAISNYRTESYRPRNAPTVPSIDPRTVAKVHYDELSRYLAAYLARDKIPSEKSHPAPANSRSTARQKLTRLTRQQFQELSTDVYDELMRRKKNLVESEVPFLPVRDDFHPKRNQARQKLATLPTPRFEDLSSDVYFELSRRYPEFKDGLADIQPSPTSAYDDFPSPDFPNSPPQRVPTQPMNPRALRVSEEQSMDQGYGVPGPSGTATIPSGRRSEERRRPADEDYPIPRRSEDIYTGLDYPNNTNPVSSSSVRRKPPSQENFRRSEDREREPTLRRPSMSNGEAGTTQAQTASATSGIIIPIKSTIAEEEIDNPFRSQVRGGPLPMDDRGPDTTDGTTDIEPELTVGGLSGLTARLRADEDEEGPTPDNGNRSEDYFDKLSFGRAASAASDRSITGGRITGGRTSVTNDDHEKLRRDYEFKIATMQSRITGLERDLSDADEVAKKYKQSEERVRLLEEELTTLRRRTEEQTVAMHNLQRELDGIEETRTREKEREARRARQDEEDLQLLRSRCEKLEQERVTKEAANPEIIEQLRGDIQSLILELSELSSRNDELTSLRETESETIRDLSNQLKDYRRKYEQAKTELRSIKATSQLFLQAPKLDDQLPMSPDGGILDIHITAFLSAIDGLLTAGRSNAPVRVLGPMKSIVNAVTAITEDVQAFESRPMRERSDVDAEALRSLRERADATLGNLAAAAKTHAASAGMSPVSLLDAAASHVSVTVTELAKTVCIRKASKTEQEQFVHMSGGANPTTTMANGYTSPVAGRPTGDMTSPWREPIVPSGRSREVGTPSGTQQQSSPVESPQLSNRGLSDLRRPSSYEQSNSPSQTYDKPSTNSSDNSAQADNPEDAWAELKPYLEAQTESIVYAIQSVLSGVRSPTPSPTLNENLTQIITIVSSIVAVCNDNIPPASAEQGNEILRELGEHANKLSEVQALPEITKESRQIMAKSSFAVANAMKGLMKL